MKHKKLLFGFLLASIGFSHLFSLEKVWDVNVSGMYTQAGTIDGDLVVVNGDVYITSGNLIVNGDLKVTTGFVRLCDGNLKVDGDLIITNTNGSGDVEATLFVGGDLEVTGAVITKSVAGDAYVDIRGDLEAGRVSTRASGEAYVITDNHIKVTGAIVTKSEAAHAFVVSRGESPTYGDINAGAIFTYAVQVPAELPATAPSCVVLGFRSALPEFSSGAVVRAANGHVIVTGPIVTHATRMIFGLGVEGRSSGSIANAHVYAEGNIEAASITTYSDGGDAYVSGERVTVDGDIRTEAKSVVGSNAHVEARESVLQTVGTFEDIVAQNIYTKGDCQAHVIAYRNIDVKGDIVTWDRALYDCGAGTNACVKATIGYLKAQNVMTKSPLCAYVQAQGDIDVVGDVLTSSDYNSANVYSSEGRIRAGNIATEGVYSTYIYADQDVDVAHVITTKQVLDPRGRFRNGYLPLYVRSITGDVKAEKIFTKGYGDADVTALNDVLVKGPISTRSVSNMAKVFAGYELVAGAMSTYGSGDSSIESQSSSINVVEDIRTKSSSSDADVSAINGNIKARSIKTDAYSTNDDSIRADAGSAEFTLVPDLETDEIVIENAEFNLDSDHEWPLMLTIDGTCTLNGNGHVLTLTGDGGITVSAGAELYLQNMLIRNVKDEVISCGDDSSILSLHNVTFMQSDDYTFDTGMLYVRGLFQIKGPGKRFIYTSSPNCMVLKNSTIFFDHGLIFEHGVSVTIELEDRSSRIHFNDAFLDVIEGTRFKDGTFVFDNMVTFSIRDAGKLYFGNNNGPENIGLEFHEASKLIYSGDLENQNV
ncbi:FapA family protein [Candidatus Dependentiae bacterium]|nr:FapA family protein [Candidatus Dependentiae bacterium]